jgi:hypothetical protein
VPFVGEANSNPVPIEGPELLDETVIEFLIPLPLKESDDLGPPVEKLRTVSPEAILGVPVYKLLGGFENSTYPRLGGPSA